MAAPPPEPELNELLRRVDWRFLLGQRGAPRLIDRHGGSLARALALIGEPAEPDGEADLVVLGFPDRDALRSARRSLRPGGRVVCLWQHPAPLGVQRVRARLKRAGFADPSFHWPGPRGATTPRFWLPLDSAAAIAHLHAQEPVHSRREAALRLAWRGAVRAGAMAPLCAIARQPGPHLDGDDPIAAALPGARHWLLLTGGSESDNKAIGLPFPGHGPTPAVVAKLGRAGKADRALDREAELLSDLERERPGLVGVPRLRASGTSAGGRAVLQDAMLGTPLGTELRRAGFAALAPRLTEWLISLAGNPPLQAPSEWWGPLVAAPIDELETRHGRLLPEGFAARARSALAGLGALPLVWEHRDLGPWNVVIGAGGGVAAIDWEDAEPRGLPALDLVYLLATSALSVEGVLDDPGRSGPIVESYARLLDPGSEAGEVVARCFAAYRERLGVGEADFQRLRLLCWIVQALIAVRRKPSDAYFIHLAKEELVRLEKGAP